MARVNMADAGFGRPEDKDIERQFMKKIRGDKLQAINAECQLQICLAFKEDQKQVKKSGRSKKQQPKVEQNQTESMGPLDIHIPGLNVDRRGELTEYFTQFKEKWEFQEIKEGEPLPEYFFDDGCDLSYILHEITTRENYQEMFKAEELIFLELLCLWGRKLFNEKIKEYYNNPETMNFMKELMETGLEKIVNKLKDGHHKEEKGSGNDSNMQDENQEDYNMQLNESLAEQASSQKKGKKKAQPPKTKKIAKEKNNSKAKKNKKKGTSEQSEQQDQNKQSEIPEQKELAVKTINYICWAYWYIIKKGQ